LTTEKRIDDDIYYALTSLKLGISSLVKPEDLISSEPSSDLKTAVYHQKRTVNRSQTMIYTYQVSSNVIVSIFRKTNNENVSLYALLIV